MRLRQVRVHGRHHLGRRVRAGDREYLRVRCADESAAVLRAEAAGDDHLAVLRERFADRVERLGDRGVDEAAGVDDDEIGAVVGRRDRVAFGLELRDDLLGVDERLRAAERDEADARPGRSRDVRPSVSTLTWARCISARERAGRDCAAARRGDAARVVAALAAVQRFFSSSGAVCCAAPKLGNGNAANMPRVWSCIRCCMSMKSFALCSR